MPLLHKRPFTPEQLPRDLRPEEEVFVCKATQEVFRDYEKFFHRHFLCNSHVWTCSLTGQSSLTYTQAADSEREAMQLLLSFPLCYQRAVLELIHHAPRTNIRSLADELLVFFKERFTLGETLLLAQATASGAKVLWPVKIVKVIPPDPASPIRVPVISSSEATQNGVVSPSRPLTNGISGSPPNTAGGSPKFKTPRTPTPRVPLTPQVSLPPSGYRYVVERTEEPHTKMTVNSRQLSRPKGKLHPKKLKLFLRNALHRPSEKHPFRVIETYVQQFDLGASSVSSDPLPSPSPSSRSRKRSYSQASLDSFLSPTDSGSAHKKPRPSSLDTSSRKPSKGKKTPQKMRRKSSSSGKSKTPSSGGLKFSRGTPKSPKVPKSPKTPRNHTEALRVLNKAKKFHQMDLKKSVVRKAGLTEEELEELQRKAEEERRRWLEVWEEDKRRRREERMERLRALQEQKRLEKLRQRELTRPREDTLCTDSKPLPAASEVSCHLPVELFGETVMVLEFLHSFGPLFNIREVIREEITFEKLERGLLRCDTDTILCDLVRFLVQAVLAAMEEDHEDFVRVTLAPQGAEPEGEGEEGDEGDEEGEPLDVKVKSICGSSVTSAQWSWLTQRLSLGQLVMDPYSCSEVLRLHLLSSGGYSETATRKRSRCYRRGGYTDGDNPAIALRLRRPDLLTSLNRTSVYDLSPGDKLEVLSTVCGQLVTSSLARDHMEESAGEGKRVRRRIREIQYEEEKRKRESRQQKAKEKREKGRKVLLGAGTAGEGENTAIDPTGQPPPAVEGPCDSADKTDSAHLEGADGDRGSTMGVVEGAGPRESEEERRERVEGELARLREELREATSLQPLGSDRQHRRYWLFPNLPGLFVEDLGFSVNPPTLSPHSPHSDTSPQQEDVSLQKPHPPAPPTQPSPNGVGGVKWYCYSSEEEFEHLVSALDVRGVREKVLKETLTLHKSALLSSLARCRQRAEHRGRLRPSPPGTYTSGDQYLELYLREQILDTEEKVHLGNLGHLRGPLGREQWRELIENSGAAAELNAWRETGEIGDKSDDQRVSSSEAQSVPVVGSSVQALSEALLEVEAGIEHKFLMPPLGTALDSKERGLRRKEGLRGAKKEGVKGADVCREQWRASLTQATSFSQVFLHLATLERAIMWSRSLMNVRCRICRRKGGDEFMLLCDGCDHGYHTYCLKPPLQQVPEGDWFCRDCSPVTPVKPRRRNHRVTFQEVESSESEEEKKEESYEEEEEEEEGEGEGSDEEEEEVSWREAAGRRRSGRLQKKSQPVQQVARKQPRGKKTATAAPPRAKRKLNMARKSRPPVPSSRAESVVSAIIELRCSRGGHGGGGAVSREQRGLEMQLCEALWEEVSDHDSSWPFTEPVKKREYPDYHSVVAEPTDLKTIRSKIKRGEYTGLEGIVSDMTLLFSNCQLFHRKHSEIGRAGLSLQRFFEKRCSDLGLKDLGLVAGAPSRGTRLRSSRRK